MRAVVVYESMYGNTHQVAEAIASGLRAGGEAVVVPVGDVRPETLTATDLLVVGGPTHVHGMSRQNTRHAAVEAAAKPGSGLHIEPDAEGPGLRDWLGGLHSLPGLAAAFDTRVKAPALVTGRASRGIAARLVQAGLDVVKPPESFLVSKENHLEPGETDRACAWGAELASLVTTGHPLAH